MLLLRKAGIRFLAPLSLLLAIACTNNKKPAEPTDGKGTTGTTTAGQRPFSDTTLVTVAAVLPSTDGNSLDIVFNERAHVLTLTKEDKGFADYNRRFEAALKAKTPLKIITDGLKGNLLTVADPSPAELEAFRNFRKEMLAGDSARRIDIDRIDTATFNIVDKYLQWPVFKLCTKVVPDYATAKKIFDYCAKQSCHLPGPYDISPCIPFQYVIDGCYARAHKMRWIIEKKFGYCSEKVFSFANVGNHRLAVKANKWGGCCVQWWFHVTPLIRVKATVGKFTLTMAYVIDPGMFDQPVLLSTWLNAQKNTSCNANATVDFYSIQPSSAYLPTYPTGAPYTTDPNYTQTNATLLGYANGHTCP